MSPAPSSGCRRADDVPERLREVLHVLYLVFTEGHTASSGAGCTGST